MYVMCIFGFLHDWCTNLPPTEAAYRNNVISRVAIAMTAGHIELLALAQKIPFCECWKKTFTDLYGL